MLKNLILIILFVLCSGLLSACGGHDTYAPVTEISRTDPVPRSGEHRVTRGETLYSIAWRYGFDYQELARKNHIAAPYTVYLGQVIYLRRTKPVSVKAKPKSASPASKSKRPKVKSTRMVYKDRQKEPSYSVSRWYWPVRGRIVRGYSWKNKGIDIAGRVGTAVKASAPGKVVYSGNGLRSYGNLIIIKHNSRYLSAYAYNRSISVTEGQWVKAGQPIAEMGVDGLGKPRLHFEIRRNGKSVNPLKFLK